MPGPVAGGGGGPAAQPVAIGPADYQAFEQILKNVQTAWSASDLNALRSLASPEMVGYSLSSCRTTPAVASATR